MCEPNKISYTANPMNGIRKTIQNKPKMVVIIEPPKRKGQKLGVPSQKTFSFWSKTLSNSLIVLFGNVNNYSRLIQKIKNFSSPKMRNREFVFTLKSECKLVAERSEANQNSLTFLIWRPREESNPHQRLRSPRFYPLNYGGRGYSVLSHVHHLINVSGG